MFASVLLKFCSILCAKAILNDYGKYSAYIICLLLQCVFLSSFISPLQNVSDIFESMRREFDIAFSKIQEAIISNPPPINELRQFLANRYNYLHPQVEHSVSIIEILTAMRDHCTLIDISCLEGIVKWFGIKEAESYIPTYKNAVQ